MVDGKKLAAAVAKLKRGLGIIIKEKVAAIEAEDNTVNIGRLDSGVKQIEAGLQMLDDDMVEAEVEGEMEAQGLTNKKPKEAMGLTNKEPSEAMGLTNKKPPKACKKPKKALKLALRNLKAGARHSNQDLMLLQAIHDMVIALGAQCHSNEVEVETEVSVSTETETEEPEMPSGEMMAVKGFAVPETIKAVQPSYTEGNALKALGADDDYLYVANYMALWGSPERRDLAGDYFTADTNFESDYTKSVGRLPLDWEHRQRPDDGGPGSGTILGYVDWTTAKKDARGLWVIRALNRRNEYVKQLVEAGIIEAGILGSSSEAVPDGVVRYPDGWLAQWPVKGDALTFTPMEHRMLTENTITPAMKAVIEKLSIKETTNQADKGTDTLRQRLHNRLSIIKKLIKE